MNGPLIDLPLQSFYTEEDASRSTLVNGDFEGAAGPPPASWVTFQCLGTREAGARTGGSGSYVGQEAWDGVNAYGLLMQGGMIVGARYTHRGYCKPDGATRVPSLLDDAVTSVWTGTAAGVWQTVEHTMSVGGTITCLRCANLAAGGWVQWDDLTRTPHINRTKNAGLLGGAVQLGDGLTPATLPTMIGGGVRGMRFLDTSHQRLALLGTLASSTYSVAFLLKRRTTGGNLFDARTGGGVGYLYYSAGVLAASSGIVYVEDRATTTLDYGELALVSVAGVTISSPSALIIGENFAFSGGWNGDIHNFGLWPGTLTPTQLRSIGERWRATLNLY